MIDALSNLLIDTSAYRRVLFEFGWLPTGAAIAVIVAAFVIPIVYWSRTVSRGKILLSVLRAVAIALIAFLVLDPTLVGQKSVPGSQFVLLLFDDSKSMTISEPDGSTRAEKLLSALSENHHGFERELAQTHQLATYRFGSDVHRIRSSDALRFQDTRTEIASSLEGARQRATGTDVAAIVLFSDGIEQSAKATALSDLPDDVPVFTVGTGTRQEWRSLALTDVAVSRSPFDRSPVRVNVGISAHGLINERVVLEVLDGDRRVTSDAFELLSDSLSQKRRLEFVPDRAGWVPYRVRLRLANQPFEGITPIASDLDPIPDDNVRDFVVDNRERTFRILFFSGRPNWEHKFVRRALTEDEQINIASLIRISGAERKFVFRGNETSMSNPLFEGYDDEADHAPRYDEAVFLRIGVSQYELVTGYPLEPEDLYDYHAVIWSDIESDFFSTGHLELTRDFVADRGGSMLLLGGPRSLAEGGYAGSVIEPMLPVVLSKSKTSQLDWSEPFSPSPTMSGILSGIWSLDPDPDKNRTIWEELPALYGVNPVLTTRAGADVLARISSRSNDNAPLFALQRYGEGSVAVLTTGETWPLTMRTEDPDPSHGRFWRQMIRSLIANVPDPVVFPDIEDAVVGEPLVISTLVRDSVFVERESLDIVATLHSSAENDQTLPVEESIETSGAYGVSFTPTQPGVYRLALSASDTDDNPIATDDHAFVIHPNNREHLNPQYNPESLHQIADHTGGRFFELADLDQIPPLIPWEQTRADQVDRIRLWNTPLFYVVLTVMLILEWYLRRRRGEA